MTRFRLSGVRLTLRLALLGLLFATHPASVGAVEQTVCTRLVASGNPEYPPFLWRDPADDSHLIGAVTELMKRLSAEIGIPITVNYVGPWGRVQEEARQGHIDLIAGAFFTLPRLEYLDYFQPPIRSTRSVIWTRSAARINYHKWSDLVGLEGTTVINNSFGEAFDRYAEKNLKIHSVASVETAFKVLTLGRAQYLIYEEDPGAAYVARLNIPGLHQAEIPVATEDLFLTMSHHSACNTGTMRGRISQAMNKLVRERTMDLLIPQAIERWRKQG